MAQRPDSPNFKEAEALRALDLPEVEIFWRGFLAVADTNVKDYVEAVNIAFRRTATFPEKIKENGRSTLFATIKPHLQLFHEILPKTLLDYVEKTLDASAEETATFTTAATSASKLQELCEMNENIMNHFQKVLRHLGQLDEPEEITKVKLSNQQTTMQRLVHSYLVCLDNNSDQREKISQLVKEAQSAAEDLVKKDDAQKELTEKLTAERKTTEQLREKMKSLEEQLQESLKRATATAQDQKEEIVNVTEETIPDATVETARQPAVPMPAGLPEDLRINYSEKMVATADMKATDLAPNRLRDCVRFALRLQDLVKRFKQEARTLLPNLDKSLEKGVTEGDQQLEVLMKLFGHGGFTVDQVFQELHLQQENPQRKKGGDGVQPQLMMWPPIWGSSPSFQTFVVSDLGISKDNLRLWLLLLLPTVYKKILLAELFLKNTHDAWGDLITRKPTTLNSATIARCAFHWVSIWVVASALEVEQNHQKGIFPRYSDQWALTPSETRWSQGNVHQLLVHAHRLDLTSLFEVGKSHFKKILALTASDRAYCQSFVNPATKMGTSRSRQNSIPRQERADSTHQSKRSKLESSQAENQLQGHQAQGPSAQRKPGNQQRQVIQRTEQDWNPNSQGQYHPSMTSPTNGAGPSSHVHSVHPPNGRQAGYIHGQHSSGLPGPSNAMEPHHQGQLNLTFPGGQQSHQGIVHLEQPVMHLLPGVQELSYQPVQLQQQQSAMCHSRQQAGACLQQHSVPSSALHQQQCHAHSFQAPSQLPQASGIPPQQHLQSLSQNPSQPVQVHSQQHQQQDRLQEGTREPAERWMTPMFPQPTCAGPLPSTAEGLLNDIIDF